MLKGATRSEIMTLMKADYLGDANDHFKGQIHRVLRDHEAVRELYAVPMVVNDGVGSDWTAEHASTYARLVGLTGVDRIVPRTSFSATRRTPYFRDAVQQVPAGADVLVDPNTGIRRIGSSRAHVLISELQMFTDADPSRLILVYDESRDHRQLKHEHVRGLGEQLAARIGAATAYEAGRNITLFAVARDGDRVALAHDAFACLLGPAGKTRLRRF
jgi:hypothetical protein